MLIDGHRIAVVTWCVIDGSRSSVESDLSKGKICREMSRNVEKCREMSRNNERIGRLRSSSDFVLRGVTRILSSKT